MKVILIDDEKHALITLQHLLADYPEIEVLATIQNSREAKEQIERLRPDLVFLDIEMPLMNGFELLAQFESLFFKVVFTTAYGHYAIQALKLNALDYLLKPIVPDELAATIEKYNAQQLFTSAEQVAQLNQFTLEQLSNTLALSTQQGLHFIQLDDIMYFRASSSYTYVKMQSGEEHLVSKPLSVFEEVLNDKPIFFRAHKSNLINLRYIKQYIRGEGGEIIMQDGTSIALSRSKKQEFLNFFKKI